MNYFSVENISKLLDKIGNSPVSIKAIIIFMIRLLIVLIILIITYFICHLIRKWCEKMLFRIHVEETLALFLANVFQWGLFGLVVIGCLSIFGIETTSFAAAIGGISVAMGLAFQGSLSNVAAGIMLLIFRPYRVGNYIMVDGKLVIVRAIELFFTTVDTFDNRRLFVPNRMIFGGVIENQTFHNRRRIDITVGVGYDDDLVKTREVLTAATKIEGIGEVQIYLEEMNVYSIDWKVRCWVNTSDYYTIKEKLIFSLKTHLDQAGIEIPFPYQVQIRKNEEERET